MASKNVLWVCARCIKWLGANWPRVLNSEYNFKKNLNTRAKYILYPVDSCRDHVNCLLCVVRTAIDSRGCEAILSYLTIARYAQKCFISLLVITIHLLQRTTTNFNIIMTYKITLKLLNVEVCYKIKFYYFWRQLRWVIKRTRNF